MIYILNFLSAFLSNLPLFLLPVAQLEAKGNNFPFKKFFQKLPRTRGKSFLFSLEVLNPSNGELFERIIKKSIMITHFQEFSNRTLNFYSDYYTFFSIFYFSLYAISNFISIADILSIPLTGLILVVMLYELTSSSENHSLDSSFLRILLFSIFCFLIGIRFSKKLLLILLLIFALIELAGALGSRFLKEKYLLKNKTLAVIQGLIFGLILGFNCPPPFSLFLNKVTCNLFNSQNFSKAASDYFLTFMNHFHSLLLWGGFIIISLKILLFLSYLLFLGFCFTLDYLNSPFTEWFVGPKMGNVLRSPG